MQLIAEKPIIFNAPMVRALLDGRKTQARGGLDQSQFDQNCVEVCQYSDDDATLVQRHGMDGSICGTVKTKYAIGDRLWVREAWTTGSHLDHVPPRDISSLQSIGYLANEHEGPWLGKIRPSIHMPRRFSRITLEVTDVRIERLQDISEDDARAEGARTDAFDYWSHGQDDDYLHITAKSSFRTLWESINGQGSWNANPWVAAYTFKVLGIKNDDN